MDEILSSANEIAADYYQERQLLVSDRAARAARLLANADLASEDTTALRASIAPEVRADRVQVVQVYRVVPGATPPAVVPLRGNPNHPRQRGAPALRRQRRLERVPRIIGRGHVTRS